MNVPPYPLHQLVKTTCAWCGRFPCVCVRAAPCVCGGAIVGSSADTAQAIREHQDTPQHVAWRHRNDL